MGIFHKYCTNIRSPNGGYLNYLYLSIAFFTFPYVILHRMVFVSILTIRCLCGTAKACFDKISRDFVKSSKL